jgi:DsbC/DsbD-like thiol-disulfide interchange protein
MGAWLYPEGGGSARYLALVLMLVCLALTGSAIAAPPTVDAKWRVDGKDLVLTVALEPGWHVNAHDPDRPYLIPTTLDVDPPGDAAVAEIRYPEAVVHSLAFAADVRLRLYEGSFPIRVRLKDAAPPRLDARLTYQACNDETCLPPRTLTVPYRAEERP